MNSLSQDPGYGRLKDHLIVSTGLAFYTDRDEQLTEMIAARLSDLGLRDCSSYAELLAEGAQGSAEMDVLIAQLTVGETYFFRDAERFAAIRNTILPDILQRKRSSQQLRIWSAGCATGAEPYSLAILLANEMADQITGWQVSIHASDVNRRFLAKAAEGNFRAWALRCTSDKIKGECFSRDGLVWTIHPRFKQWISFHHMNLVEGQFSTPWPSGPHFDLILCCNVMIYFAPQVSRRLIGQFHDSLGDQGWLVVGASECNIENYKAFRTVNASGARLYQKVALPGALMTADPEPKLAAMAAPPAPAEPLAKPPAEALGKSPAGPGPADVHGLRQLADRGDWQGASEYGQRLLTQDRLSPAVHFYQALIFENLGMLQESERSLRQAIYLDRDFALAHYHLGLVLQRDRKIDAAARSFGNVLKVLAGMPDQAIVTAGPGVTVIGLKELAQMHLKNSSGP